MGIRGKRGLPKKYAKMGFKRGWKAYKAAKRSRGSRSTRSYRPRKRSYRRSYKSNPGRRKGWGIGRYISAGRLIDVITRPLQQGLYRHGASKEGFEQGFDNYACGLYKEKKFNKDKATGVYSGMASGLAVNYAKSRTGVYKKAGKGKILSIIQSLSPELLALKDANPIENPKGYDLARVQYDSGYDMHANITTLNPKRSAGQRFWEDKSLNILLGVLQKVVFDSTGPIKLNRKLPKGLNF